jgi:hypothetical protein
LTVVNKDNSNLSVGNHRDIGGKLRGGYRRKFVSISRANMKHTARDEGVSKAARL